MLQLALKPTNTEFGKSVHLCLSGEDLVVKRVQHSGYVDEVTLPLFNLADTMQALRNVNKRIKERGDAYKHQEIIEVEEGFSIEIEGGDGFVEILSVSWEEDAEYEVDSSVTIEDCDFSHFMDSLEGYISEMQ